MTQKPRRAHFHVVAQIPDRIDGKPSARLTIETDASGGGLFSVRPFRRRREYTLTLAAVARIVVGRVVAAEVAARKTARRTARGLRRGS